MNDPNVILSLLGIPWVKVSRHELTNDGKSSLLYVELKDERSYCPKCGSTNIGIKDYYSRTINSCIIRHNNLTVIVRQRRYVCHKCGKTFKQKFPISDDKASISNAVKLSILEDLKERKTFSLIAKEHDVSPTTVMKLFDKGVLPQRRGKLPNALCIDEYLFAYRKGYGKYPSAISDYFTGEIIDVIPSRQSRILFDYFNKINLSERREVKFFISDMNEAYRTAKKVFFKDAIHIIDMYHITKLFTEAIKKIRVSIYKSEEGKIYEYGFLKKNWKLFNMHVEDLKKMRVVNRRTGIVGNRMMDVNLVLKHYPKLHALFYAKEEFHRISKHPLPWKKAEEDVNFLIENYTKSCIPELESIGRTFQNWKLELINTLSKNTYGLRLSNAVAESNNNSIKTLFKMSYGLLNFERSRKRILYISRNRKTKG